LTVFVEADFCGPPNFPTFPTMKSKHKPDLIYGRHPVIDAINAGTSIDKLMLQQGTRGDFEKEIRQLARTHDIPLQYVPKERMNKMTKGNHQGIIGLLSLITYYKVEDVLPMIYEKGETPLLLILDGITDVRNLGAIARSAEVCGAHALIVPGRGSAQINAEALKTSAGALATIPVCRASSLVNTLEMLKEYGIRTYASDLQGEAMLAELDLTGPVAFILGSEGEGISKAMVSGADQTFRIPQKGQTDSFNVSVAAGIMLYEVVRQRQ
jgi:23S rRNA (guanosine2251-2'-O)-methyltransferase